MKQGKEKDKLYISRSHTKARIAYLEIKKTKKGNRNQEKIRLGREKDKNSISISHTYSRLSDVENVNTDSFYFLKLFSPGAVCTTRMARTTCTKLGKRTGFSLTRSVLDSMIVDCLAKIKKRNNQTSHIHINVFENA